MIIKPHLKQHYKPEFNKTFQTFLHGATQHRILKIYSLQLKVTHWGALEKTGKELSQIDQC